jgi:hypothetical protein
MFNKNLRDDAHERERTMTEDTSITAGGDPALAKEQDEAGLSVTAEVEAEALALSGSRSVLFADWLAEQAALCQPLPSDEAGRGRPSMRSRRWPRRTAWKACWPARWSRRTTSRSR